MGVLTRAEKRRARAREGDRIGSLPDDVLGDIVSLLPTKQGARTQILSSRWRHLWRSAPLNPNLHLHLHDDDPDGRSTRVTEISRILSAHPGPCRRFVMPFRYAGCDYPTAETVDGWLRSPALDNLQELLFYHYPRLPLPPSVCRFSSTLRAATFVGCSFPDGNNAGALLLPVLESLTLSDVSNSGSILHALLAGCPALQSLVLIIGNCNASSRLQIVSPSLRSIEVTCWWRTVELVIEDTPLRTISPYTSLFRQQVSAWKILGIKTNPERIGTLNIRLRKLVLQNYQGSKSHVDFFNFFLSNAKALEALELGVRNVTTNKWIARQHSLLSINVASRDAQVTFCVL